MRAAAARMIRAAFLEIVPRLRCELIPSLLTVQVSHNLPRGADRGITASESRELGKAAT